MKLRLGVLIGALIVHLVCGGVSLVAIGLASLSVLAVNQAALYSMGMYYFMMPAAMLLPLGYVCRAEETNRYRKILYRLWLVDFIVVWLLSSVLLMDYAASLRQ